MNLREKKVLTTAERNQLVNEYGPLQIVTVEATEEMPKITKLIDKDGLCTSHFMVQDLFEWQYGNEIEELPADEKVPTGPVYYLNYESQYGEAPSPKQFRLTDGFYELTEEDLPNLVVDGCVFTGWTINGTDAEVGMKIQGSVKLVAKIKKEVKVGDYLYSDLTYSTELIPGKTPIAVAVIPASHSEDGKITWMSLANMSLTDPENGTSETGNDSSTNPGAGIKWGANGEISGAIQGSFPGLVYDDEQHNYFIQDHAVSTSGDTLPSDVEWIGVPYPFATGLSYYKGNSGYGTSPFLEDGSKNPLYANPEFTYQGYDEEEPSTDSNLLANMSGFSKTAAIIEAATATETEGAITNSSEEGHYPAAMACHRFTAGVEGLAGQWYLPEVGELGYLPSNLRKLNIKINAAREAGFTAVAIGDIHTQGELGNSLWSSSEYSEDYAWYLYTYNCIFDGYDRSYDGSYRRVRAFLRLTPSFD